VVVVVVVVAAERQRRGKNESECIGVQSIGGWDAEG